MVEVQRLQGTFVDHDLPTEEDNAVHGFRTTGTGYGILISILNGHLRLNVGLVDSTADEQADQVLRPAIDEIGQS